MSVQAVAWAFRQELPPVPKLVLIALCERANSETGECWPGIDVIAMAVCLSERSVVTYIAALVRNGFVMKQAMRGKDGRRRNNHYWILFDRSAAPWIGPGGQVEELPGAENEEDETGPAESPPDANLAHGDNVQTDSHGPHATACTLHITPEPSGIEPSESERYSGAAPATEARPAPPAAAAPPPPAPRGFAPNKRQAELDRIKAADEARKPKKIPVIRGSEPWNAWIKHGHSPTLIGNIEVNGRPDRGWYFDTLWPPKAGETGPPLPLDQSEPLPQKRNTG